MFTLLSYTRHCHLRFFTVVVSLLLARFLPVQAQQQVPAEFRNRILLMPKNDTIDISHTACIYQYDMIDTLSHRRQTVKKVLLAGKKLSKFEDYSIYRLDSLETTKRKWTSGEYLSLPPHILAGTPGFVIKQSNPNIVEEYQRVGLYYHYLSPDTLPPFQWKLEEGGKTVCGYPCKKATTTFRGRRWTAWYTEKIPLNNGPWKFSGLPGLITEVYDNTRVQHFKLLKVRKQKKPIYKKRLNYSMADRKTVGLQIYEERNNRRKGSPQGIIYNTLELDFQ